MPKRKRRRFSFLRFFALLIILIVIIAGAAGAYGYFSLRPAGEGNKEVEFDIEEGDDWNTVLDHLKEEDMIKNVQVAKLYIRFAHARPYYAGTFLLNDGMSTEEILNYISDPDHIMEETIRFTIPEGTWAKDIAASLSKQLPFSQEEILALWNDQNYIDELAKTYPFLDPSVLSNEQLKVKLEGYLFPETYFLDKDMTLDQVTRVFLDQFNVVYQELKPQFDQSGMSVEQVVTLASIIQFESGSVEDMKSISGVFHNRLAQNMKLESSVTVCYALYDQFDDPQACETQYDVESPYNTYLNEGLPPGPILNPGKEAIIAALEPEENDYLFFAADIYHVRSDPGKVYYSTTYEEHQQIVEELHLIIE